LKFSAATLPSHLAQRLLPAYLVSGEEPLLAREAADEIRAAARRQGFTEREVHFIERGTRWDELQASSANLSLFARRRLLEIRLPTGKPGVAGAKALLAMLGRADPDTLLLVLTERLDRDAQSAEWVRALEARGGWVALERVTGARFPRWLQERCRRAGIEASPAAIELLAARTEGNLLAADQEIAKLALLAPQGAHAPRGELDAAAMAAAVVDSSRFNVYELGGALHQGDAARALKVLAGLQAEGEELVLVLWSAVQSLRRSATGAPGAARGLGRLVARAVRVDRMIKGRLGGDPWDELALLVTEICGPRVLPVPEAPRP
jgi:DNA polymerase-3 subunit delta